MARIRLNLRNLTITEKVAKGRQIITAMSNNASFPSPSPALTQIATKLDDLDNAFALVQSAKSEVSTRVVVHDNAETAVDQLIIDGSKVNHKRFINEPLRFLVVIVVSFHGAWLIKYLDDPSTFVQMFYDSRSYLRNATERRRSISSLSRIEIPICWVLTTSSIQLILLPHFY